MVTHGFGVHLYAKEKHINDEARDARPRLERMIRAHGEDPASFDFKIVRAFDYISKANVIRLDAIRR